MLPEPYVNDMSGKRMKISQVDINELQVSEYQRPTSDRQVDSIAQEFDPVKAGLIIVSERDGKLYLMDGAHRVGAMRKKQIPYCPALILTGLTYEEEADYFRRQGENTRRLSNYDRFRAGLEARDPVNIEIAQIVKKHDFVMSSSARMAKKLTAVQTVATIYRKYGAATLDKTLMLIRQTWDGCDNSTKNECLMGVAEFISRFGTIDFVERFSQIRFSQIYQRYQMTRDGTPNGKAFCRALVQKYNENLRNGKKKLVMGYED